jgi:phosphoglycolate phosphatase-like HAD superfamily hydrolase
VEAAKLNGIRSIAVATGLCPAQELSSCCPDLLLPDLRALRLNMLL